MYIPEFWCGVAVTLVVEVVAAIAYAVYCFFTPDYLEERRKPQ